MPGHQHTTEDAMDQLTPGSRRQGATGGHRSETCRSLAQKFSRQQETDQPASWNNTLTAAPGRRAVVRATPCARSRAPGALFADLEQLAAALPQLQAKRAGAAGIALTERCFAL
jgi:hypothetical protein